MGIECKRRLLVVLNVIVTLSRNVKISNGGADVYGLGTKLALAAILPTESATSQFRYGENGEIVKTGFLPSYKGVPLVELGNALVPNTVNGTPQVVVPDDIIYMIPMGWYKPIKIVIEGDTMTLEEDFARKVDHTFCFTVTAHMGFNAVVGTKFGALQLN